MPCPSRNRLAVALVSALLMTGCTGSNEPTTPSAGSATGANHPSLAATATTAPATPNYRILSKPALTEALLGVQGLSPGYSQDAPSPAGPNKTFCNYRPPFTEKAYVSRDFTKGAGLSAEILRVGLRRYADSRQAKAAFNALTDALRTCTEETSQGTKLTYAPMSAVKVGDASVGVKIAAGNTTLLQNFALVGPTLVSTGGGGLMNANADEISNLLRDQVKAYDDAALQ